MLFPIDNRLAASAKSAARLMSLSASLLVATTALAGPQSTPPAAAAAQAQKNPPPSPAAQLSGLDLMNTTVGSMLPQASHRVKLLTGYIQAKGLDGEFSSYQPPKFYPGVSFQNALAASIEEAQLVPTTGETSDTIAAEVAGQTELVKSSWDELQGMRLKIWNMTSFVRSKNLFDDYHAWAIKASAEMAAKAQADEKARIAAANAAEQARKAQADAAIHTLEERWDKIPYSTGIDYNFRPSQNQTVSQPGNPIGNGSYNGDNYWNGSYYNGYADPYYDVWGVPDGIGAGWGSYWRGYGRGTGAFHPSRGSSISAPRPAGAGFHR